MALSLVMLPRQRSDIFERQKVTVFFNLENTPPASANDIGRTVCTTYHSPCTFDREISSHMSKGFRTFILGRLIVKEVITKVFQTLIYCRL